MREEIKNKVELLKNSVVWEERKCLIVVDVVILFIDMINEKLIKFVLKFYFFYSWEIVVLNRIDFIIL